MVKKIIVTALVLAAISFAQFGQNSEARPIDKNDYYYHPHTGLYFTTNIGFGYASMNSHHETNRDTTNSSFSGWWTPSIEVRLGGYYVDISAFYAAIGFECGTGKYEKTNPLGTSKEIEASSTRMFFGFGGHRHLLDLDRRKAIRRDKRLSQYLRTSRSRLRLVVQYTLESRHCIQLLLRPLHQ